MDTRLGTSAGFTLIELVVALTITTAVLAMGYAAFGHTVDARTRARASLLEAERVWHVRSTLEGWLSGTVLPDPGSPGSFAGVDRSHRGTERDHLVFRTTARTGPRGGRAWVRLEVDDDEETQETGLVARVTSWMGADTTTVEIEPEVTELEIRYLSPLEGTDRWLPSWISSTELPRAVEIRMAGSGSDLHPLLRKPIRVALGADR